MSLAKFRKIFKGNSEVSTPNKQKPPKPSVQETKDSSNDQQEPRN